jgi:hypothetical protein
MTIKQQQRAESNKQGAAYGSGRAAAASTTGYCRRVDGATATGSVR